jgi:UDP-N-acetylmuramate--alanine ligase
MGAGKLTLVDDYGITQVPQLGPWVRRGRKAQGDCFPAAQIYAHPICLKILYMFFPVLMLMLMDVYSAGEAPIAGTWLNISRAIRIRGQVDRCLSKLGGCRKYWRTVKADDVLLTMGAGNVGQIATQLPQLLAEALTG